MRTAITFMIGVIAGLAIAYVYGRVRSREDSIDDNWVQRIEPPLNQEEFERKVEATQRRYHDAMDKYDKLVPWAAGGGLVVSLGFVPSIAQTAPEWTRFILGGAWAALVGSLLCSILSQYTSTRIQVWYKQMLEEEQSPPDESASEFDKEAWRNTVIGHKKRLNKNGRYTKRLNVSAGALLVAGLVALGVFAVLAAPFGSALPTQ